MPLLGLQRGVTDCCSESKGSRDLCDNVSHGCNRYQICSVVAQQHPCVQQRQPIAQRPQAQHPESISRHAANHRAGLRVVVVEAVEGEQEEGEVQVAE